MTMDNGIARSTIARRRRNMVACPVPASASTMSVESNSEENDIGNRLNGGPASVDAQPRNETSYDMVIDMSAFYHPSDGLHNNTEVRNKRNECCTKLNRTLRTDGFALVRGFGVSASLCNDALRAARSFLHEADELVRRSCLTKDRARRGYSPMCTENFASLIGEQGQNDLVKKYRIGPEPNHASGQIQSTSSLHQPNEWPTEESWDQDKAQIFKSTIERYFETICKVADCILRVICDGIIAENENTDIAESVRVLSGSSNTAQNDTIHGNESKNHTSILTLLGYQPGSRHKKGHKSYMRPLISAHTDVGVITVLHFDGGKCAALERAANNAASCGYIISSENIEWIDVNLPKVLGDDDDPIFVVNVGDCLSELSGGTLRSTLHRVMPRPLPHPVECEKDDEGAAAAAPRTCLALFVGLEPTASLKLPHSGEVLSYEEWRRQRIARATAVMKR